jgi:hypothetical protein
MKTATIAKLTAALALATLSLTAGTSWANDGFNRYGPGPEAQGRYGPRGAHEAYGPRGYREHAIDARLAEQRQRIREGVRSGRLTAYEARGLWHQQRYVERMEHRFLADGWLSPRERMVLNRGLERTGRAIYAEKHDRERRR